MSFLLIIVLIVLVIQILMFFSIRSRKQDLKETSEVQDRYHIKTRADAWRLLNSSDLPEADRIKVEDFYKNMK